MENQPHDFLNRIRSFLYRHREGLAITGILLLAIFFRFWQLDSVPPGLHPDEAANGLDVLRIFGGDHRPLYATNGPREALFFYLMAPFVWILGNTILALRLAPALIGSLAVLATYLFMREWFSKRAALIGAFLMASAPWAVTLTRDVFRAALVPLMIPLTIWLYTKAVKTGRKLWYILAGVSLGAGFYTYLSFRIVPFLLILIAGFALIWYRQQLKEQIKPLLLTAAAALVVLLPLIIFAFYHPADVIGGRSSVSFLNEELNNGQPLQTLATTVKDTALMFNFAGDENFRHNLGGEPMLNFFVGIMFVLGVGLSLVRIKDIRYFSLLAIFGAMLVPEVLTAEGIPHGLRAIGVLPVVYVFAAIGIVELIARWRGVFPFNPAARIFGLIVLISILTLSTFSNFQRYFVAYANAPPVYDAYSEDVTAIAHYMNEHEFSGRRILVVDGYSIQTIQFLSHGKADYERIDPNELADVQIIDDMQIIVAATQQHAAQPHLRAKEADFMSTTITSDERTGFELFTVYNIKKTGDNNG